MKSKHIAADAEARLHVIVLDQGEEAFAALTRFANESGDISGLADGDRRLRAGNSGLVRHDLEELPQDRGQ